MAAQSYYNYNHLPQGEQDHHSVSGYPSPAKVQHPRMDGHMSPSSVSSGQPSPLKPYHLGAPADGLAQLQRMKEEDDALKVRIRRLRLISRLLAFCISIAILVPIAMTLHKFLSTRDIFRDITSPNGKTITRTAWAKDSKVWPTYVYFFVAVMATFLHVTILISYMFGVSHANRSAIVTAIFSWGVMVGNLVVWIVAAVIYRREKDLNGKSNDLWGWTCSRAAREIQQVFAKEVNFNQYCNIQTASWYAGLVQVGAAALTIFIYILAVQRRKLKKRLHRQSQVVGFEPVRHAYP